MKSAELTVITVVRSARSISGKASLTARAAARLEFHATAIRRPSVSSGVTGGMNNTGRPVTNSSFSEKE